MRNEEADDKSRLRVGFDVCGYNTRINVLYIEPAAQIITLSPSF